MKTNNIVESLNKVIDKAREDFNLSVRGHLVTVTNIDRLKGQYKKCTIRVEYINLDKKENELFAEVEHTDKCPSGEEDKLIEKTQELLLEKLFSIILNELSIEDVIHGLYTVKRRFQYIGQ